MFVGLLKTNKTSSDNVDLNSIYSYHMLDCPNLDSKIHILLGVK